MKVKDLVEKLQKCNQELQVVDYYDVPTSKVIEDIDGERVVLADRKPYFLYATAKEIK